jgi:putative peptidoglycan lipid II flippase
VPGATAEAQQAGQPLAAILAWLIFLLALAETFRAIYYRADRLVVPSAGRVGGVLITVAVVLWSAATQNLTAIAWGLVAGAAFETVVTFVGLFALPEFRFRPTWPAPAVLRDIARTVGMPLAGQGLRVVAAVAERALASFLGPGALTAVAFAGRLIATLERFVFRGFQVATIQAVAARARYDFNASLRLVALLAIPLAAVFGLLAPQVVTVFFGRGRFGPDDVVTVATTLAVYAPAIVALGLSSIPLGLAFGHNRPRVVLGYFAIYAGVLVAAEVVLLRLGVGLRAFGIATTIAAFAGFLWLRYKSDTERALWTRGDTVQFGLVAAAAVGGALLARLLVGRLPADALTMWLTLAVGGGACLLATALAARALHLQEYQELTGMLNRLRPRPRS